ncbi:hypothetical protein, partial [Salmonella enterica]|uniref:hypothetical protein n=1 Tax=Salmonella enterica TaxID=28901 RepID=UPI003D2AFD66
WVKIGTNGDRSYEEGGVTVAHKQSVNKTRSARSVGAIKAFRASEDMTITVTLMDLTLEQYAYALGQVQPSTTVAGVGTVGFKKLGLSRG